MISETDIFFDLDDFAEIVQVNSQSIKAIFDRPAMTYQEGYATIATRVPQLTVQTVDLENANVVQGSTVTVRNQQYSVAEVEDDGTGISTVFLHKT